MKKDYEFAIYRVYMGLGVVSEKWQRYMLSGTYTDSEIDYIYKMAKARLGE